MSEQIDKVRVSKAYLRALAKEVQERPKLRAGVGIILQDGGDGTVVVSVDIASLPKTSQ